VQRSRNKSVGPKHEALNADFSGASHDATSGLNYSYDQENRITGAAGYAYTYDGDGNRVKKSNGSTGTLYWYMSPGIVAESDLSGNLTSEYAFFDGEHVARRDGPNGSGGVFYYFSDHLKTTDIVTDAQGNIKNESDFYPWGGELQFANSDSNHYKFTGKERDTETGLDYFGARYYSNGLGRFITPDWAANATAVPYAEFADPQSLNQHSYVRNIPTVKVDKDGHLDVEFKSSELEQMFDRIGAESTSFHDELDAAKGDHNITVTVQQVGGQKLGDRLARKEVERNK
jgi:RHS repeat-associated protein